MAVAYCVFAVDDRGDDNHKLAAVCGSRQRAEQYIEENHRGLSLGYFIREEELLPDHEHDWGGQFGAGFLLEKCYHEGCEERRWRMRSDDA